MSKFIRIGDAKIPLDSYAISGTAILGIRKSGKTVLAKGIVEQLLDHCVTPVIFDAIGVWRHMKRAGDGPNGKAFKIVVAGGVEPDLPLTPDNAAEIVRAAIRENIPLVIDLYDKKLSKADWRKIVRTSFRTLLYENEGVRHIVLEEAAEYVPQKVMDGEVFAEVEKVVRMGGNASLGITLINQRAQEVNKSVLDLCENMILMRQRGAHAIDSLEKWMDRMEPDRAREIAATMPNMSAGNCWVFAGEGDESAKRTQVAMCRSFHPDRSAPEAKTTKRTAADTSEFVTRLSADLVKVVEQAKADDPKLLRAEIAALKKQLAGAKPAIITGLHTTADLVEARKTGERSAYEETRPRILSTFSDAQHIRRVLQEALGFVDLILKRHEVDITSSAAPAENPKRSGPISLVRSAPSPARPAPRARQIDAGASSLNASRRKVLAVLSTYGECDSGRLALLSGYTYSGGFRNILASLRTAGFIEGENTATMSITAEGEAQGPFDALPVGDELRAHWLNFSQFGTAEREVLRALLERPRGFDNGPDLAAHVGKEYSGGFRNVLSKLRTAGVLVGKNTGQMTASVELLA